MTVDQLLQLAGYLATGGGGYAGSEVVRWLRERGKDKAVLDAAAKKAEDDLATRLRDELRADNVAMRAEVTQLRDENRKGQLDLARLEGHVQALADENTKLRNENLVQKGENAMLLAKVEMLEKVIAQLTNTTIQPAPTGGAAA